MEEPISAQAVSGPGPSGAHLALHPKYRPDIDGLRAIAVLAVLGFHAFPDLVGGGFIGVDIFFVISGFLISSILFANFEQQSFTYAGFYSRRIRRIFPALAVVLLACFAAGWFLLLPSEYEQLGRYMTAGSGFVSNLLSWHEAGYFDNASNTKPLLHLWSLGVEEQFYILWPLLIGICWRYRFNFLAVTLLVAAASFGINIYTAAHYPDADFYSPLSRFWELMLGGVLAYVTLHKPRYLPGHRHGNWLALLGLGAIAIGIYLIRGDDAFPGWWALLPTAGTFLLIAAPPTAWVNRFLLSNRVMVGIGLISYPLYLWHMPLLVIARIINLGTPPAWVQVMLLLASVALAAITYLWVEKPLRFRLPARRSVPILLAATSLTLVLGVVCMLGAGIPARFSPELQSYLTFTKDYDFMDDARDGSCWLDKNDPADGFAASCVDAPAAGKRLVLIWGDSHAARFYPGLKAMDDGRDRLAQFTRDACPPIIGEHKRGWCDASNDFVATRIQALKPDIVILFSRWSQHLSANPKDPKLARLMTTLAKLKEWGIKRIIVMGPAPNWENKLPEDLARQAIHHHEDVIPTRTSLLLVPNVRPIDLLLARSLDGLPGVTYFSAYDALCDDTGCLTSVDGKADGLTSFDYGHLTLAGADYLAQKLAQQTGYPDLK